MKSDLHKELNIAVDTFLETINVLEDEHGVKIEVWRSYMCHSGTDKPNMRSEVKKTYKMTSAETQQS